MNVNVAVYAEWPPNVPPQGASAILSYQVQFDALPPVTVAAAPDPVTGLVKSGTFPITDLLPHAISIAATNQWATGPAFNVPIPAADVPAAPSGVVVKFVTTLSA